MSYSKGHTENAEQEIISCATCRFLFAEPMTEGTDSLFLLGTCTNKKSEHFGNKRYFKDYCEPKREEERNEQNKHG